jgi:hypothetical protein
MNEETMEVLAAEGDAGFIAVQSGEGDAIPGRGWRGAPTPKRQRTGNDFTAQKYTSDLTGLQ